MKKLLLLTIFPLLLTTGCSNPKNNNEEKKFEIYRAELWKIISENPFKETTVLGISTTNLYFEVTSFDGFDIFYPLSWKLNPSKLDYTNRWEKYYLKYATFIGKWTHSQINSWYINN